MIIGNRLKINLGTSLVEFIIASGLGLLVIMALLQFYLRQNDLFSYQQGLARLQENGRIISYIFSRQLQSAGYSGCAKAVDLQLPVSLLTLGVWGFRQGQVATIPTIPANLAKRIKVTTDVILVNQLQPLIADIKIPLQAQSERIRVKQKAALQTQAFYLFSDCTHIEQHTLQDIKNPAGVKIVPPLMSAFAAHSQLSILQQAVYFISETGRYNKMGHPIYALNRYLIHSHYTPQELIEGVEDMKIFYGLHVKQQLRYRSADALKRTDWQKVKSIRIHVLLNSIEPVLTHRQSYTFMGQSFVTRDRLLRKEWIITVALRQSL